MTIFISCFQCLRLISTRSKALLDTSITPIVSGTYAEQTSEGQDEYLIQRYQDARISTQAPRSETINEKAKRLLQDGSKTSKELVELMPDYPKNSIFAKLSLNPRFVNIEKV